MKKLLGLAILISMFFLFATNVFAASFGQLYVDYSVNGVLIDETASDPKVTDGSTHDAKPFYIGADYWFDRFKVGAEYETGNAQYHNTEINDLLIKAGYCIFTTDVFQFVIMAGYGSFKLKSNDTNTKEEVTSTIMAYDSSWQLERSNFNLLFLFPLTSDYVFNDVKDSSKNAALFQAKAKYTYYLTEQFGLSIGFHMDGFVVGNSNNDNNQVDVTKGFTLGATYGF